jgi:hypothetical protein
LLLFFFFYFVVGGEGLVGVKNPVQWVSTFKKGAALKHVSFIEIINLNMFESNVYLFSFNTKSITSIDQSFKHAGSMLVLFLGAKVAASAIAVSPNEEKKAWLVLAWVSTVAGNL